LLLLARIASLPEPNPFWGGIIVTKEPSAAFYRRFGFALDSPAKLPGKVEMDTCLALVLPNAWRQCRAALAVQSTSFDPAQVEVPIRPKPLVQKGDISNEEHPPSEFTPPN
jgi:hypothetical protein